MGKNTRTRNIRRNGGIKMNKDLQKILYKYLWMIIGCFIISIFIHLLPLISSILFGFIWCQYIQNKKGA